MLENIRDRGVKDVFFFCVDGLNGFSEAIASIFPVAITQRCIVHMVRTSLKFVSWKDYKAVCQDLRAVYTQDSPEAGMEKLQEFKEHWQQKYPEIAAKWEANWAELSPFFDHPEAIRRAIYTTNVVEALHRTLRKATKTKGAFISESALEKQLYLTLVHNQKSWKGRSAVGPISTAHYEATSPNASPMACREGKWGWMLCRPKASRASSPTKESDDILS